MSKTRVVRVRMLTAPSQEPKTMQVQVTHLPQEPRTALVLVEESEQREAVVVVEDER